MVPDAMAKAWKINTEDTEKRLRARRIWVARAAWGVSHLRCLGVLLFFSRPLRAGLTYAAPPALVSCGEVEAGRIESIEERSFVAKGAPLDGGQKRRRAPKVLVRAGLGGAARFRLW